MKTALPGTSLSALFAGACLVAALPQIAHADYSQAATKVPPLESITSLDLQKYQGRWFEIAKLPNRFQSMCAKNTSAQYQVDTASGTVKVTNQCTTAKGETATAEGSARAVGQITGTQLSPAKLEVAFAPTWLRWLPVVWGNYWVIAIDPEYRWALVSEPNREFAWLLARERNLTENQKAAALSAARKFNLPVDRLDWTVQD